MINSRPYLDIYHCRGDHLGLLTTDQTRDVLEAHRRSRNEAVRNGQLPGPPPPHLHPTAGPSGSVQSGSQFSLAVLVHNPPHPHACPLTSSCFHAPFPSQNHTDRSPAHTGPSPEVMRRGPQVFCRRHCSLCDNSTAVPSANLGAVSYGP